MLLRQEPDGSLVTHAKLDGHGRHEIVVDSRGNIYLNDVDFTFGVEEFKPGTILLLTPDCVVREVADSLAFPNGMVVTPDKLHPDRRRVHHRQTHPPLHHRRRQRHQPVSLGRPRPRR